MEDNQVGGKELLVARNDKGGGEVYGGVLFVPKAQEPSRGFSRQVNA